MKYLKYPSTTILKHVNVLSKANKLSYKRLLDMTPCCLHYYNPRIYNDHIEHYSRTKGVKYRYRMNRTVSKLRP